MKKIALILFLVTSLNAQTISQRDEIKARVSEYLLKNSVSGCVKTNVIDAKVRLYVSTYNGPLGSGKIVKIMYDNGRTNRCIRIIDQGPEGRGKDVE